MSGQWRTSNRRKRLPADWPAIRLAILIRDHYLCYVCKGVATEVDHLKAGDDHSPQNLAAICAPHHLAKSSAEGGHAASLARQSRPGRRRPRDPHPGLK